MRGNKKGHIVCVVAYSIGIFKMPNQTNPPIGRSNFECGFSLHCVETEIENGNADGSQLL